MVKKKKSTKKKTSKKEIKKPMSQIEKDALALVKVLQDKSIKEIIIKR